MAKVMKWFSDKGFGFVSHEGKQVFMHVSAVRWSSDVRWNGLDLTNREVTNVSVGQGAKGLQVQIADIVGLDLVRLNKGGSEFEMWLRKTYPGVATQLGMKFDVVKITGVNSGDVGRAYLAYGDSQPREQLRSKLQELRGAMTGVRITSGDMASGIDGRTQTECAAILAAIPVFTPKAIELIVKMGGSMYLSQTGWGFTPDYKAQELDGLDLADEMHVTVYSTPQGAGSQFLLSSHEERFTPVKRGELSLAQRVEQAWKKFTDDVSADVELKAAITAVEAANQLLQDTEDNCPQRPESQVLTVDTLQGKFVALGEKHVWASAEHTPKLDMPGRQQVTVSHPDPDGATSSKGPFSGHKSWYAIRGMLVKSEYFIETAESGAWLQKMQQATDQLNLAYDRQDKAVAELFKEGWLEKFAEANAIKSEEIPAMRSAFAEKIEGRGLIRKIGYPRWAFQYRAAPVKRWQSNNWFYHSQEWLTQAVPLNGFPTHEDIVAFLAQQEQKALQDQAWERITAELFSSLPALEGEWKLRNSVTGEFTARLYRQTQGFKDLGTLAVVIDGQEHVLDYQEYGDALMQDVPAGWLDASVKYDRLKVRIEQFTHDLTKVSAKWKLS